jgi:Kef-type K+ transport system membrane component KefB
LLTAVTVLGCFLPGLSVFADIEYCDVYVGTRKVFVVTNSHVLSAVERGEEINERIKRILKDPELDLSNLSVRTGLDGVPMIMLGTLPICEVTTDDAAPYGENPQSVANEWLVKLRARLKEERKVEGKTASGTETSSGNASNSSDKSGTATSSHGSSEGTTLGEHAVLLLFVEIAILLFASLAFGELMVRLGQPAIIGQCFAGVMLGQTVFGNFFPDLSALVFPQDNLQSKLISVVSWIGVSFILMLTGMETDVSMLKRLGKPALYFAVIGLLIPLLAGGGISLLLPGMLMQDAHQKFAFAVFVGTVFAASSVPVVAQVLMDLKMLKHDIGQLVLSASLSHDLLSCLLLAVIAVLAGNGKETHGNPIVTATIGTACFLLVMYFGRPFFFFILRGVNDKVSTADGLITAMIVMLLACAAVTQALGVHIVLGAFAAGVILSQTPVVNTKVVRPLEIMTMGFFAPIFFASAGLNVNLSCLLDPKLAIITMLLSIAAVASKLGSCYYAGKLAGLGTWESLAVGAGANTKGSMGLILAILGYSLHIISIEMFAMVIFVSLFTTAVSPGLMKYTLAKIKFSDEETDGQARAALQNDSSFCQARALADFRTPPQSIYR